MKVVVGGSTGLIGRALVAALVARGDDVVALGRRPGTVAGRATTVVRPDSPLPPEVIEGATAFVNLAGAGIGEGRWSSAHRREILESRLAATAQLADAARAAGAATLVSGSAVGYYGTGEDERDETSPSGDDFLAMVCRRWEEAALAAGDSVRVVLVRTGVVLARDGGALAQLVRVARLGVNGRLGTGRQWMPWIHLADEIGLLLLALDDAGVAGPMNATSPNPVRQAEFARELGRVLHRPSFVRTPALALRVALGGAAELALAGQRVAPGVALARGYDFVFPDLSGALEDLLAR